MFADTGEVMEGATLAQAEPLPAVRRRHRRPGRSRRDVERVDQWTLVQSRQLPLHKFRVNDERGTELYVSPRTGEVTMVTTRRGRALAWISTIPHFFYFAALRENQPVWYQFVVWTSGLVCALAVLGLVLGVVQSFKQKYTGAMKWHYVTGLVFGVFTATWAFSGLLSMEPFEWTNSRAARGQPQTSLPAADRPRQYAAMKPGRVGSPSWTAAASRRSSSPAFRTSTTTWSASRTIPRPTSGPSGCTQPHYITGRAETDRLLVRADTLQVRREAFSAESLVARSARSCPTCRSSSSNCSPSTTRTTTRASI